MPVPTSRGGGKLVLEPPEEPLARRVVGAAALRDMLLASPFSSHSRIQLDLLHIFKQFSEGQPCFPELDRAHVVQGRVNPRVVVEPHPLVDPLPQMLGVGKRLAVDEPPLQAVVGRLDHGVVVRAALPRQGSLDAEDLEHLVYRGVGELASADALLSVKSNSRVRAVSLWCSKPRVRYSASGI